MVWCNTSVWCRTCTVRFLRSLLRIFSSFQPIWVFEIKVLWKVASSYVEVDDDELMLNVLRCHLTYLGQVVTNAEARFSKIHIRKVYACLAVTCHLHFWQNDRDFLRATVVTRGCNGYWNKSQHRKSTLEKKILPPFQQGFEPTTFQSRVRCYHWAIPTPTYVEDLKTVFILSWVQHEEFYYDKATCCKSHMQLLIQDVYSISSKTCQMQCMLFVNCLLVIVRIFC